MSEMKLPPVMTYGRADLLEERLGLKPVVGQRIAAIIIFAATIEHHLERALWKLKGLNPQGIRPETDARMISDLIGMLERFALTLAPGEERTLLETWGKAARFAFAIRNDIAHGVPTNMGETLAFMNNPRWHGETRKRPFSDYWAEHYSLDLVRHAFAVLLRVIVGVSSEKMTLAELAKPPLLRALRDTLSILGEMASKDYNPTFEKY
ncbi:hypothetical protein LB561_13810 [Mesorhizobium sp. B292B1B]|uniref:hypothetical protein n=1 Tax=unclassified Mesorhizobium TaxID=325217 RepID=UPI00112DB11B|nr:MULTISPECIES: hypothetical protein [unclassified Mesorhizobium]MCA0012095.1 hypothetical protein [Mesorhizobium sp. B294B1A1]MCA0038349.1 hypothetical protein [Mesorhizobium sp. B292B1B]TPM41184.1 hypothetical protein FJ964_25265 [Mesorhizobium sp. B2-3-2]